MRTRPVLRPIVDGDGPSVAAFLHRHLNPRIPQREWGRALSPPWPSAVPHRGYVLVGARGIVGASVVMCSEREWAGRRYTVGNLAAFSVLPEHAVDGMRMLRRQLREPSIVYTDLAPTARLVPINEKLGFTHLDTAARVAPNRPSRPSRGVTVTSDAATVARTLTGRDATIYRDHVAAPATRHIVVSEKDTWAYLVVRRQQWSRWRHRPLIALPLYAGGDRGLLHRRWPHVASHILRRHGLVATYAERRILGFTLPAGADRRPSRKRMVFGHGIPTDEIDYLYSDLTLFEAI